VLLPSARREAVVVDGMTCEEAKRLKHSEDENRRLKQVGIDTLHTEPGSPWEKGYAESFRGRLRDEFLAMEIFEGGRDARTLTASWRDEYNTQRPHSSLGYRTPAGFVAACEAFASAKASAPAARAGCLGQPCF
jgi:hypothetical protein